VQIEVLADVAAVARAGAARLAAGAWAAVAERGRCVLALSGGRTPWAMLAALADERMPWAQVHVLQVDERVAPRGHADRNLTHLHELLVRPGRLASERLHAMDVEAPDLEAAAQGYARTLERLAGTPPVLDLVHLGLGADGHTASLVPADPVLEIGDRDVAPTGPYAGRRRLTLTYPVLRRARELLFLVTGREKAPALARLLAEDAAIPAGRLRHPRTVVLADRAALTTHTPGA
jgi:6-phosphogluconolactonase